MDPKRHLNFILEGELKRRFEKCPAEKKKTQIECASFPSSSSRCIETDRLSRIFSFFLQKMGIQGLLPFLKDATEAINVRKYKGHAVAVDTYCWIHRGAVACALQLAKGEKCDQ